MRIVFMGTPDIAAQALAELLSTGNEVVGVYTREDKPVGRRQVMTSPPVRLLAGENRIPVYQPKTLRTPGAAAELAEMQPDLVVVVAYGLILPPEVLAVPKYGCINMHVSLLPKYRGAAPIQWAVINGEKETGITIMQMDEGLDTGPVLAQQKVQIGPDATAGELFELVGRIGARLLADTVEKIGRGAARAVPQQGEASVAPQLNKGMARLDFDLTARELHNLVRGCNPWPLAWFENDGKRIKVLRSRLSDYCGKPGEVLSTKPLTVGCGGQEGDGSLVLDNVVPEGGRAMTGEEWAVGRRLTAGDRLF